MSQAVMSRQYRNLGLFSSWTIFLLGICYFVTTGLGFLSLKSPDDPIGDPYVTIMELLIIPIALLYLLNMVAVYAYASPKKKAWGLSALCLMVIMTALTTSVHFVVLSVNHRFAESGLPWASLFFSWNWPSVVYALDILAWDWFFALALLFAAMVFHGGRLEAIVRILLLVSGFLSLAGLIGVPLANMQIRNIGVVGYAVVAPVALLLQGVVFKRAPSEQ